MFLQRIIRLTVALVLAFVASPALAGESSGTLKSGISSTYAKFHYVAYWLDVSDDEQLTIAMRSKTINAYLMAVAPDGMIHLNDYGRRHDKTLSSRDAAIAIDEPDSGRWLLVATTSRASDEGEYVLEYPESAALQTIDAADEDRESIAAAFAARRVEDPIRRRNALFDQLTLASFREDLKQRLRAELLGVEKRRARLEAQIKSKGLRRQELADAEAALQTTGASTEVLTDLVKKEQAKAQRDARGLDTRFLAAGREEIALAQAISALERFGDLSATIAAKEQELLEKAAFSSQSDLVQEIVRLRAERESIGKSIADKLLDSRLVRDRRFSVSAGSGSEYLASSVQANQTYAYSGAVTANAAVISAQSAAVGVGGGGTVSRRVPDVWLPALLPWPPPDASSRMVIERQLLERAKPDIQTLRDVDRVLRSALSRAGYSDRSYWGVPKGFAIVTPLEQTDDDGQPLPASIRWNTKIAEMKAFTLAEYVRALLTAPAGYFRVLIFVVSSEPFTPSGSREILETLSRWSSGGLNFLPDRVGGQSFTARHRVTVLVYEFMKLQDSDKPATEVPGRLKVPDHLRATQLAAFVE